MLARVDLSCGRYGQLLALRKGVWTVRGVSGLSASAVASKKKDSARGSIKVLFSVPYRCHFGQHLCMVGSANPLGKWDVERGVQMDWSAGDIWKAELEFPLSQDSAGLEYKYVVRDTDGGIAAWKPGSNFCLQLAADLQQQQDLLEQIQIEDAWDGLSSINLQWSPLHRIHAETSYEEGLLTQLAVTANTALADLDTAVIECLQLLEQIKDPTHPQALEADRRVAAAAQNAMDASRALQAAEVLQDGKLGAPSAI